jgi:hypothetical protein
MFAVAREIRGERGTWILNKKSDRLGVLLGHRTIVALSLPLILEGSGEVDQIAFWTFPLRMHRVQTRMRRGCPSTRA